ncbi:TIGR03086 family metal-binding protein [Glycomyces harbinensis]|uniref:TIGR03086 family protein n=1 Tax=Glycomyces harbinensis TaxID=58114 RepID=A0A1G6ZX94_9ACTN|nr:TIGR03086 family metal-binding protein [Glycomyces harbinensis]SDE07202.1 TIGR03086 family protein [Glycomyces harbinensis]
MTDFKSTTDLVAGLIAGVDEAQLSGPTPCEEYTVGHLVNHMLGLTLAFTAAARGERGPHNDAPPETPPAVPPSDWRPLLEERLQILADAWAAPGAWEGDATAGGVTFPAAIMGLVGLNEVAIHGWDLARATGQDYRLDAATLEALVAFVGQDADDQAAREGIYGPALQVAADADAQDRLIALTGRDPVWRP